MMKARRRSVFLAVAGLLLGIGLGLVGSNGYNPSGGSIATPSPDFPLARQAPQATQDTQQPGIPQQGQTKGEAEPGIVAILGENPMELIDALLAADSSDMPGILKRIQRLTENQQKLIVPSLLGVWLELDREAALESVSQLEGYVIRSSLTELEAKRLHTLIQSDPEAALAQIDENILNDRAPLMKQEALIELAKSNPERALELSSGEFDKPVFSQIARMDSKLALTLLESHASSSLKANQELRAAIAKGWAETDLQGSIAWAMKNISSPAAKADWLKEIVSKHDPSVSLPLALEAEWVRSPSSAEKLAYGLREWLRDDQASALIWLDGVKDSRTRNAMILTAGHGLYGDGEWRLGLDLLSQLPSATKQEKNARSDAMERLVRIAMREDEESARTWMLANLSTGDAASLISRFAYNWPKNDWPGAEAWFDSLPPEHQSKTARNLGEHFARVDADAALAWLKDVPQQAIPSAREAMVAALSVERSAALISNITEPEERQKLSGILNGNLRLLNLLQIASISNNQALDALGLSSVVEKRFADFGPEALIKLAPSFKNESLQTIAYLTAAKSMGKADLKSGRAILEHAALPEANRQAALNDFDATFASPPAAGGIEP